MAKKRNKRGYTSHVTRRRRKAEKKQVTSLEKEKNQVTSCDWHSMSRDAAIPSRGAKLKAKLKVETRNLHAKRVTSTTRKLPGRRKKEGGIWEAEM